MLTLGGPQFINNPDADMIETYDYMLYLQWTIILEPGKIVQLFFPMFDIENSKGCLYDRLKVFGTVKFYSTRIECKYSLGKNTDSKTVDVNKILISAKCVFFILSNVKLCEHLRTHATFI